MRALPSIGFARGHFDRFDTLFGSRREDLGLSDTYSALARARTSMRRACASRPSPVALTRSSTIARVRVASRTDRFYGMIDATGGSGDFWWPSGGGRLRY